MKKLGWILGWSAVFLATRLVTSCSANDGSTEPTLSTGTSAGGGSQASSGAGATGSGFTITSASNASTGSGGGIPGPVVIDECPGPIPGAAAAALQAGGPIDPAMKWLYPYDRTVFPGGILPPLLQWVPQGGGADAVYVHMKSNLFEYKGCFGPANPARVAIPVNAWAAATTQSQGATDPLFVELTTMVGPNVSGPIKETWTIALGSLKGAVYYNTYTSPQVGNNGAVMHIKPGSPTPDPFLSIAGTAPFGPCISCHSLSADGSTLVAQRHLYPGGLVQSESYNLLVTPLPDPNLPLAKSTVDDWGFGALYPDGTRLLTDGSPSTTGGLFPAGTDNNPGMIGPRTSLLINPKTGQTLNPTGFNVQYAKMPMFSPDGKKIVFNHHEASGGHTLAVMDYDIATDTFSNLTALYSHATLYPGWPFFTPDSKSVIFVIGNASNYASTLTVPTGPLSSSDLFIIDLATKTPRSLDLANGYSGGTTYLPYPGRDEHIIFYPTVSPIAAGGYFWVFFTSRRNFGNVIVVPPDDTTSKKIWVSAIDIDAPVGVDPSHPPFYLPGQEVGSGNIRAFATLDPCKTDGTTCMSGIDCCGGFCINGMCGPPMGCAKVDDYCDTDADCCDPTLKCINHHCAIIVK